MGIPRLAFEGYFDGLNSCRRRKVYPQMADQALEAERPAETVSRAVFLPMFMAAVELLL
jgi:hypothetical protein